ncbi:UNVERIFIED_CONTAM: hypothetical protein Slati_4467300 [Sesamum latifolium]|uniref:Uncharacterized protein n=1 Tax=Sesamum latifolium TaxID=2727402 RepID=A0AAW2SU18_9LAMI
MKTIEELTYPSLTLKRAKGFCSHTGGAACLTTKKWEDFQRELATTALPFLKYGFEACQGQFTA